MKLLFVNHAYPREQYAQMNADAKGVLQVPNNLLQWNIIEGLELNGADYSLVSVPAFPAWPRYRHLFTSRGVMKVNGNDCGHYLSYCDAPFLKQLSQRKVLRRYIRQWCKHNSSETQLVVMVFAQWPQHLGAVLDLKQEFPGLKVATVITDLIENAKDYASNTSLVKKLQIRSAAKAEHRLFPKVDKYILLSKHMVEFIPEAVGRNIIMEGIVSCSRPSVHNQEKDYSTRILLYSGALERYAGVDQLIDAFHCTKDSLFRLIVCGAGTSVKYIKQVALVDPRIIYKGQIDHEEVLALQRQATALINPRRPNGSITKYSFPSKTMEYMVSGTPMIGYRLEGVPQEYFDHMFIPKDLSVDALTECINNVLGKPAIDLEEKAEKAAQFIVNNKNPQIQVKKILTFIES